MKAARASKKPKADAGTFKKIAPPRIPKPTHKAPNADVVEAMRAMIEKGRARQLAESLPDAALVSSGLVDVTAQALQLLVLEKVKKLQDGSLTAEEQQFLFDLHQGALAGVVKAHDTVANSPFIPLPLGRSADGAPMPHPAEAPKETRLSGALAALRSLDRPAQ